MNTLERFFQGSEFHGVFSGHREVKTGGGGGTVDESWKSIKSVDWRPKLL